VSHEDERPKTPAQRLLGVKLRNGWRVIAEVPKPVGATGGHFSHGYIVENENAQPRRGFLKALDYSEALAADDPARELQLLTAAYNFERDLLARCREQRLSKIVMPLDDGAILVDPQSPSGAVQYLIFELGDGDIRQHLKLAAQLDLT
jgi:eukaryotic-like serine/threonine-protein kinase